MKRNFLFIRYRPKPPCSPLESMVPAMHTCTVVVFIMDSFESDIWGWDKIHKNQQGIHEIYYLLHIKN